MSQSQDPGESVVAHDTRPTVRNPPEISTAPPTPNAESGPPNLPWTLPPRLLGEELEKRKTRFTNDQKAEAWKAMAQVVQRYSDEQIKRWNAEIDTYLVFAGLLSAIITAFNVETYLLLQPNTPDPTLLALQQISLQLSSFSTGSLPAFVNSTHPAFQQGDTPPPPIPLWAIWLNTLWFTSLIFSLSSASIGIMAKQWLNEYASGISSESEGGTSRQTARLRQYRLNNLVKWHVGDIVNTIPVLLQVSVALFLAGLLVLLWTLHPAVAAVTSVLASVLGAFTLTIVLLPSVKSGCAYLSPQSTALYYVLRRAPSLIGVSLSKILVPLTMYLLGRPQILGISTRKLANALWEWEPVKVPTWHGIEQTMVSEGSQSLDADIISTAYDIAMNPDLLATAAICLSELEPNIHVVNCVERLQVIDESHFGVSPSPYVCAVVSATGSVIYDLWADSLLCHSTSEVQKITAHHHTDRHPISDLDDRLFRHFLWAERHLSGFEQGAVERVLLGLSLAACHVEEMSINTKTAHKMLHSIETVLIHCSRSKFSPRNVRYAAAVAYQRISEGPAPDIQHLDRFCVYMGATVVVLECILASEDVPQDDHLGILVHPYADRTLLHLIGVLRHANEEDLAKSDQFWMYFFVLQLSNLVNIVTEKHVALPAIRTLFPQDRISALEHAVATAQGVIRRWSQSENAYWH